MAIIHEDDAQRHNDQRQNDQRQQINASPTKNREGKKSRKHDPLDDLPELPLIQVRAMFQERMKALMMQDRNRLRKLFEKYDKTKLGLLTTEQFWEALSDFGVEMSLEDTANFMRRYSSRPDIITFSDFFHRLLGMPQGFFTMDFAKAADAAQKANINPSRLPEGTTHTALVKRFMNHLRSKLYDVPNALLNVMRQKRNQMQFDVDHLNDIFTMENIRVTKRELKELMDHFDLNCNGKINYYEFVYDLLDLPIPQEIRQAIPSVPGNFSRTPLSLRGQELANQLRVLLIDAAARPSRIDKLFQQFDKDGTGTITYDEIKNMVRDFSLEMNPQDGDSASVILSHMDRSTSGMVSYDDFVASTVGCTRKGFGKLKPGEEGRPSTSKVHKAVSDGLKELMYDNPGALKKAFSAFDVDCQGSVSWLEFKNGLCKLGIPINKSQMRKMFDSFVSEGSNGLLKIDDFKRAILGAGQEILTQSTPRAYSPYKQRTSTSLIGATHESIPEDHDTFGHKTKPPKTSATTSGVSAKYSSLVPSEFDSMRPMTGSASISQGNEAAARKAQDEEMAKQLREMSIARIARSQGALSRPQTGSPIAMQALGGAHPRSHSVGEIRAKEAHRERMAQVHGVVSSRGVKNKLMSPDGLGITASLLPPPRSANPNPYLPSPLASPERIFGLPMTLEAAKQMTTKNASQPSNHQMNEARFASQVIEHDRKAFEFTEKNYKTRGASPQTNALLGELKSRELNMSDNMAATLKKVGGLPQTKKQVLPSRPATQASIFGMFDGLDALKPAKTPQFIPKLQMGGNSPFQAIKGGV